MKPSVGKKGGMVRRWFRFRLFFSHHVTLFYLVIKTKLIFPTESVFHLFSSSSSVEEDERAAVGQLAPAKVKPPQGVILSGFVALCKVQAHGNLFICKVFVFTN